MNNNLRYQLLILFASFPVALFSLWQALRYKDPLCLWQRFGLKLGQYDPQPLWIHTASVGEVIAVAPLISKLLTQQPTLSIVITTFTPTGKQVAQQRLPAKIKHCYLPLDTKHFVRRFFQAIKPCCGIVLETELWPNLFAQAKQLNIPLIIVNGRLSKRTLNTKPWIKHLYRDTLAQTSAILARSPEDAKNYVALGAHAENTHLIGNIKFGATKNNYQLNIDIPIDRPFVLAASTHDNEEQLIARIWQQIAPQSTLLVIAPRHPQRASEIIRQLREISQHISVRSKNDRVTAATEIYLADTLGELGAFMAKAQLVFMGGTLVPVGGHNILEPALLGKAIVFGPYMDNFSTEATYFLHHQAAIQISDVTQLSQTLQDLLAAPEKISALGTAALNVMTQHQDIINRYINALAEYCPAIQKTPE